MEWHSTEEKPEKWMVLVLFCAGNVIYFDGEFDGEDFKVWNNAHEIWEPPDEKVIYWMRQYEVEKHLVEILVRWKK